MFSHSRYQCYRPEKWSYNGELLLGLKYNPTGAAESLRTKEDITVECGLMGGQLQVCDLIVTHQPQEGSYGVSLLLSLTIS